MKKNELLFIFFNALLIIAFMFFYFFTNQLILLFIINFAVLFEMILKYKVSIFSLKFIIVNYILLPLFYQYLYNESYGLLELSSSHIHYSLLLLTIFIYNMTSFIFLFFNDFKSEEESKLNISYRINGKSIVILCLLAILCCIIAFPTVPFSYDATHRFEALLPGNAWNHVVIICLIFLLGNLKSNSLVKFTYFFSFFWFLSHYERVDIVGFICLLFFVYFIKKRVKFNLLKIYKYCFIILVLVIAVINIGYIRGGYKNENFMKNIFVQSTASDIAYVYNVSLDYNLNNKLLHGASYKQYIIESIPLLNYKNSILLILNKKYMYPGGEYILSSPVMNFGIFFIPFFAIIENFIILKIIKSPKKYLNIVYLFITACSFRINWYGLGYIETGLIYIIPLLLFIYTKIFSSLSFEERYHE